MKLLLHSKNRNPINHIYFIAGIFSILFYFSCQQPVQQPNTVDVVYTSDENEDVKAIKDILKTIEENFNNGNIGETYANFIAEETVTLPPGRPAVIGKVQRLKNLQDFLQNNEGSWKILSIEEVKVSGSLAIARTVSSETQKSKTTGVIRTIGKQDGLFIFQKSINNQWQVICETWNNLNISEDDGNS